MLSEKKHLGPAIQESFLTSTINLSNYFQLEAVPPEVHDRQLSVVHHPLAS